MCRLPDVLTVFFYYHPPGKFQYTTGEIAKILCQELDMYQYIWYTYIWIYIYILLSNKYGSSKKRFSKRNPFHAAQKMLHSDANIAVRWFLAGPLSNLIFKSWQVCDWLAKWLIMLGFMDLRWYHHEIFRFYYHWQKWCLKKVNIWGQRSRSQRSKQICLKRHRMFWRGIYCFSKSSVKFQGHTGHKIANFDPNWVFQDCNSSLNSHMSHKMMHKALRA